MDRHIEVDAGAESICEVAPYYEAPWTQESWARGLANARLIARAPALHAENEALRDLLQRIRAAKEQKGRAKERHAKRAVAWAALRDEIDAALLRASVGETPTTGEQAHAEMVVRSRARHIPPLGNAP